ncbi:hypothetical protein JQ615_30980 [Bradyrhizobium jicamae]|uniref:Uncharacterized protein n=1 Tax=Bradyrhizobium jicamae TaxID=280332 RepID=A0ABS5FSH8_9BRAD|nr:hypothetical protein [Bradyrhizobium jicamae]MBR0799805.1 hypothetical protein [Bradyrhizobium jicamae]
MQGWQFYEPQPELEEDPIKKSFEGPLGGTAASPTSADGRARSKLKNFPAVFRDPSDKLLARRVVPLGWPTPGRDLGHATPVARALTWIKYI